MITLTWPQSWDPISQKGDRETPTYCSFTVLREKRQKLCNRPFLFSVPYFQPQAPPPPSLFLLPLPLFSTTAHIWFWLKTRMVSCGMEGFYFSMAPLSLCTVVKTLLFVRDMLSDLLVTIFITHPTTLMSKKTKTGAWQVVTKVSFDSLQSISSKTHFTSCLHPEELLLFVTQKLSPWTLSAQIKEIICLVWKRK